MNRSYVSVLLLASVLAAESGPFDSRAKETFKELVEISTTDSVGTVTAAAEAVAARLVAAGFPAPDAINEGGSGQMKGGQYFQCRLIKALSR